MKTLSKLGAICVLYLFLVPLTWANPADYPELAALGHAHNVKAEFIHVDQLVADILARKKLLIVDVRSPTEFAATRIKGAISLPLRDLAAKLELVPREGLVALY